MSALNICVKPDRCIVMQDAAAYDPAGCITEWVDKGRVASNGLFVAATGSIAAVAVFAKLAETFDDIDDFAAHGEAPAGAWYNEHVALLERYGSREAFVAVVGWSPKLGRPVCVVFTDGQDGRAFAADVGTLAHPMLEGRYRSEWIGDSKVFLNIDTFDPERDGVRLMTLQRAQPAQGRLDRDGQFLIGGHIKLTEVFRDRIEQRVMHEWEEDRIGERIRPAPRLDAVAHPNVIPIGTMSRADRRRQAKLARRSGT